MEKLVEIKKGQTGRGILIEHDGYISMENDDNKKLFENVKEGGKEWFVPNPFIVSAVFQKFGIENANGRIYPEETLKREVEKYQVKIKERRAYGECYRPEAMILTESGWKRLDEVKENENVLTLNVETYDVEYKPIKNIIKYNTHSPMLHIYGEFIDDVVTAEHEYPLFDENNTFVTTKKAIELCDESDLFIPCGDIDNPFTVKQCTSEITISESAYNDEVFCVEVDNHVWYVMDNGKCHWTKNCNHPSESVIDLGRICMNIIELHWEGHTLVGKMEIETSEAFRRFGAITCLGDMVANHLLNGLKIGVSSRGVGSVEQRFGKLIVGDDFELICWDVVSEPSTPNAWISTDEKEIQTYVEEKQKNAPLIFEKFEKYSEWLND